MMTPALVLTILWFATAPLSSQGPPAAPDPAQPGSAIRFADIARKAGVHAIVDNCETPNRYQIEPMIAGVALFDFDNDGLLDIYVCNGARIPELEKTDGRYWNRLYRNLGGLRFEDVTEKAGVAGAGYSMGVAAADYDGDGDADLYVTGVSRNQLFSNRGNGRFEDRTKVAGVEGTIPGFGKGWSVGAGWFDYDNDSDLDLFVVNYCVWSADKDPYCGAPVPGYRTYCHPSKFAPLPNILYRNNGDGTFADVSTASGIGEHPGKGMGLAFADYNSDGWIDAVVSNDTVRNFLFKNTGRGTFEELGLEAGIAYSQEALALSGMGADFGDFNNDGRPDLFITALANETFPLFKNRGDGMFDDDTYRSGLAIETLPWGGWGMGMVDLDNDGWLDLFVAAGHVQTNLELYSGRVSKQANLVFQNLRNGQFKDVSAECGADFRQKGLHRGAAFGDLDNDGRIDVVVTRLNEPVEVFHNRTESAGHWLSVKLEGAKANRQGLGAEVTVTAGSGRRLVRLARSAVGYGGSSDPRVHFGLGGEREVRRIEVRWPGGKTRVVEKPPVDQVVVVRQE